MVSPKADMCRAVAAALPAGVARKIRQLLKDRCVPGRDCQTQRHGAIRVAAGKSVPVGFAQGSLPVRAVPLPGHRHWLSMIEHHPFRMRGMTAHILFVSPFLDRTCKLTAGAPTRCGLPGQIA